MTDSAVEEGILAPVSKPVVCVDFGSTFTKAALVDVVSGSIIASASSPTTIETDVLDGFETCLLALSDDDERAADAEVLACSSAGGGLRIAVLGNEALVTAEAGRRVALSSGGKVVRVLAAAEADTAAYADLVGTADADVVLLTGGTDGGNAEVLLEGARSLVAAGWTGPLVVAGNVEAQAEVAQILAGVPHVVADNVVPRIGVLAPQSARAAIREVFLSHVIGGKHLSARADFLAMVRGATPDIVLTGVELLARGIDGRPGIGDLVVVDVGGATTDVHSVVEVDPETAAVESGGLAREVVAATPVTRTVEGDLGMRWSAVTTLEAGIEADLLEDGPLRKASGRRLADPGFLPDDPEETEYDEQLAAAASGLALRRHAGRSRVVVSPEGRVVERSGKDLSEVDLLVCSGGVFRNAVLRNAGAEKRMLADSIGEPPGGWQLPRAPRVVVDSDCVLAAAGLLAQTHPEAAYRLVRTLWEPVAREH